LYREAYQPNSNLKVSAIKMTTTVFFVELVEVAYVRRAFKSSE